MDMVSHDTTNTTKRVEVVAKSKLIPNTKEQYRALHFTKPLTDIPLDFDFFKQQKSYLRCVSKQNEQTMMN